MTSRHQEAVQVRLSPLIAPAILGSSPAGLDGAVVSLDDVGPGGVTDP